ncbi:MAG: class I mannose-6-phosphate isomerase [Myxococcales bacterium]|nr:class I mannose-6-phosphate isomerase [Myxococcales bacterium]MDD9966123.1 class I mannose-6-phosphate isomerase [Myxococcales bacterium]
MGPLLLQPDNFTPATRTPWGGTGIVQRYKPFLIERGLSPDTIVGESWELSTGPEFPSLTQAGQPLGECIDRDRDRCLGRELMRGGTALLVKWLEAADNLSVQIHPSNDYPGLSADEGGKPECWYVLERQAGAGLYVGLNEGVDRPRMEAALASGDDLSKLLRFWPVEPGDFFVLDPGTPHAIGRGVMLIEPQFVAPGRKGVTYRYWDWNRRYDAQGRRAKDGTPRPLHAQQALNVTEYALAGDPEHAAQRRMAAGDVNLAGPAQLTHLCGVASDGGVVSEALQVARLAGSGRLELPPWPALRGLTVIEGEVRVETPGGAGLRVPGGHTAALPAALDGDALTLRSAHAIVSAAL